MGPPKQVGESESVWQRLRASMSHFEEAELRAADRAALALKLASRAKILRAGATEQRVQSTTPFLAFSSGHERFGVPLSTVIEIQALDHYSPVPNAPSIIVGVIPWRGTLTTLFDLGRLFGIRESGIADYHLCIVVEAASRRIAIAAREVEDIVGIASDDIKMLPESSGHAPPGWITGVYDQNRVLLCLEQMFQDEQFTNWKDA